VLARLTTVLAITLAAAACGGGGSSSSSAPPASSGPPVATTLPPSGTVRLSDGITYTVAAPGSTLRLDNLTLRIDDVTWTKHVSVPVTPPGTRIYAAFRVTVTNLTNTAATIPATQIWLRNTANHTFLVAAAPVSQPLVGRTVQPGQHATGTLVFPLPSRMRGGLLVYRFGDEPAKATHVGIARYD
jgi:Domain of unknown function (DUF4352)